MEKSYFQFEGTTERKLGICYRRLFKKNGTHAKVRQEKGETKERPRGNQTQPDDAGYSREGRKKDKRGVNPKSLTETRQVGKGQFCHKKTPGGQGPKV